MLLLSVRRLCQSYASSDLWCTVPALVQKKLLTKVNCGHPVMHNFRCQSKEYRARSLLLTEHRSSLLTRGGGGYSHIWAI